MKGGHDEDHNVLDDILGKRKGGPTDLAWGSGGAEEDVRAYHMGSGAPTDLLMSGGSGGNDPPGAAMQREPPASRKRCHSVLSRVGAAAEVGARSGHEGSKGADEGEMGDRAAVGIGSDDGQRGGDTGHGDDDDEGRRAGGAAGGAEGATKKKRKRKKKNKTAWHAGHTGANKPRHHRERR